MFGELQHRGRLHRRRHAAGEARGQLRHAGRRVRARLRRRARPSAECSASVNPRLPFWVAAGLSLANFLYGFFILPESLPPERRAPLEWRKANPIGSLQMLRRTRSSSGSPASCSFSALAHEALPSLWVLYTDYRFGWDDAHRGPDARPPSACACDRAGGSRGRDRQAPRRTPHAACSACSSARRVLL